MPFTLRSDEEAAAIIRGLQNGDPNAKAKLEKVNRALGNLQRNPRHPGLNSYEYQNFKGAPPDVKVWHSYVENNTPGAWRIFWRYGPDETENDPKGKNVRVPVISTQALYQRLLTGLIGHEPQACSTRAKTSTTAATPACRGQRRRDPVNGHHGCAYD